MDDGELSILARYVLSPGVLLFASQLQPAKVRIDTQIRCFVRIKIMVKIGDMLIVWITCNIRMDLGLRLGL